MKRVKILVAFLAMLVICYPFSTTRVYANSAKAAILMEQESGRVLYEKNAYKQMRIASITKIMTAILAIESGKLDEYVTISNKATRAEGSSIYLKPNQKIKLRDLTYGLMLRSGNDAAVAIAEHVGGSLDGFVKQMNKKAAKIGMKNTMFANPHGLDDHENHYSTAYDMALLTRYAMDNATYREIAGTKRYTFKNGSVSQTWLNKNKLLTKLYRYSTGGKTGYTKRAKRTLVSTASKNDLNLIAVTLNDRNDWKDHIAIFENAFSQYHQVKIIDKNEAIFTHADFVGGLVIKEDIMYPLTESENEDISVSIEFNKKNKRSVNSPVGKVKVFLDEKQIGETDLFQKEIEKQEDQSWFKKWIN